MAFGRRSVTGFACAASLLAAACGSPQQDGEIAVAVDREIAASPVLASAQIDVTAHDGVVTLTGVVPSDELAQSAERLAWSVDGVEDVESRLEVVPPGGTAGMPSVGAAPPEEGAR